MEVLGIILSVVGILLTIWLASSYFFNIPISFGGITVSPAGSSSLATEVVTQTSTQTRTQVSTQPASTTSITETVTTTNTQEITQLQSSLTQLQSSVTQLQNQVNSQQTTINSLQNSINNLQPVQLVGKINVTGWGNGGASNISFEANGITYTVTVKNGVYQIYLPKGSLYQVSVHYSGWLGIGYDKAPTQGSTDLTQPHPQPYNQDFTVNG